MNADIAKGIAKIHADSDKIRTGKILSGPGGEPARFIWMPRPDAAPLVATCFIINLVSLLDDALEDHIANNYSAPYNYLDKNGGKSKVKDLFGRIEFLDQDGKLSDAVKLHSIRDKRNEYAHEPDKYGDWAELDQTLVDIEAELRHLGII